MKPALVLNVFQTNENGSRSMAYSFLEIVLDFYSRSEKRLIVKYEFGFEIIAPPIADSKL